MFTVEVDVGTFASTNPLGLHGTSGLGPVDVVQIRKKSVGVGCDPEHPLLERLSDDGVASTFALSVDDFLVGKGGSELRTPVHDLLREVGQPFLIEIRLLLCVVQVRPLATVDRPPSTVQRLEQFGDRPGLLA